MASIRDLNHRLRRVEENQHKIMIAQANLDQALANLTTAVNAALPLIAGAAASTPDASVQALLDGVNQAASSLTTASTPVAPAPEPAPPQAS